MRAVGSGHSFTAMRPPRASRSTCPAGPASWLPTPRGLVTVRSGTTLRELNADLDRLGRALTNLGDIDAQTIAGALSTGTHGTGAGFGGIATQVRALELVLADGTVVTLLAERAPRPVHRRPGRAGRARRAQRR